MTAVMDIRLHVIKTITHNFSKDFKIGSGGYGDVYKGVLCDDELIAVKLLHDTSVEGFDDKLFRNEVGNLLTVDHPNIVTFLGYCYETRSSYIQYNDENTFYKHIYRVLCFEYLQGGSLEKLLQEKYLELSWSTCYNIIKGICEGLNFLHNREMPIFHLDVKPGNILLDSLMVPKLSDFGLSRLISESSHTHVTQRMIGTNKYMPPEYRDACTISPKNDVFSFGVVMIDIMEGPEGYSLFLEIGEKQFKKEVLAKWSSVIEPTMKYRPQLLLQVQMCIDIAMRCVDSELRNRPTIATVLASLNKTETQILGKQLAVMPLSPTIDLRKLLAETVKIITSELNSKIISAPTKPKAMTFQELHRITGGFSENRFLGKGAYGMVYKGVLDNGEVIAVKKLYSQPGLDDNKFQNELHNLMSVQHENIIRIVGYCSETRDRLVMHEGKFIVAGERERALCFEYMQGGTLEDLLSDESLYWEARYKIIKGICLGLKHLHTGSKYHIYHLDLKPANILLGKDWIPKIGDFGLSRLLVSMGTFITKTNSGTLGYMPPEYMYGQEISSKFDVFSLGVIIIQIIAGPEGYSDYKCLYTSPQEFIDHVIGNWCKRVQEKIILTEALLVVRKWIEIALRCVEVNRVKRPTITEIVEELDRIDSHRR